MLNNNISLSLSLSLTYISQVLINSNSSRLSVNTSVNRSPHQDIIPTSERERGRERGREKEGEGEGGREGERVK